MKNYCQNLYSVLDEVQSLFRNPNVSEVVITAEYGNYLVDTGRWDHSGGRVHTAVRHVPLWRTNSTSYL